MGSTLDMQSIRHLNFFERVTKVNTKFYLRYNGMIIFCVPNKFISKAIGEGGKNVKKISSVLKKRIKIIPPPSGIQDAKIFIENIVSPLEFNGFEVKDNEIIISAGRQSKAALIGRERRRFLELQKIIKNFFGKELKIV